MTLPAVSKQITDPSVKQILDRDYVRNDRVGAPSGAAGLGSDGKVPLAQLPPIPTGGGGAVSSVAGRTGNVVLSAADIAGFATAVLNVLAALNVLVVCYESGGTYVRPNYGGPVAFEGPDIPASHGTTAGGTNQAVDGKDFWWRMS